MNNKLPSITYIYNRYNKANSNTPAAIELRITYNKKQKYISSGIKLYPNEWKRDTVVNRPDALQLNSMLDKLLVDVRQIIINMSSEGDIDIFRISDKLKKKNKKISFITFCEQRAAVRMYGKAQDTQERYERFIRMFISWGGIKEFEDINEANIIKYDKFLENTGMKPYSKWNNYHRFLNSFIMDAIDEGYLQKNPYKWVHIQKDKGTKGILRCLTPDEFKQLKKAIMPTSKLEKVRDLFVFQTYTCLSYADLREFDSRAVQEVKGMKVYIGCRHKTNRTFTIPLLSPALDILYKYEGRLPMISNVKYNEYLKAVAQFSKIDKPLSSHWARHTGATMLLNEGIDMRIISKICGHSSTKITEQVYAKLLDETVVDAISSLDEKTPLSNKIEELNY